jgi:hypothetical protein
MKFKPGDKVWVKSLKEIEEIADSSVEESGAKRYIFRGLGYDFIPEMYKYCDRLVTIEKCKEDDVYTIEEGKWSWCLCWFNKDKPTSIAYVSDFGGAAEETTPAEVYWEQVMPQIKEIVISAYNKGVEIGKAECL